MKLLVIWIITIAAMIVLVMLGVWTWIALNPVLAIPVLIVYGLGGKKIIEASANMAVQHRMEELKRKQSDPNYSVFYRRPPRQD